QVESSDDMEDVFNQGRMMNKDEGIELEKDAEIAESEGRQADKQAEIYNIDLDHSSKVLIVTAAASQVSAISTTIPAASATIPAAKPSIPAAAPTVVAAYTRRRKRVIIRDLEEELPLKTPAETPKQEIDRDHDVFNKDVDWDAAMDHVNQKSSIEDEDDDVFVEATPLARKVPVVDYQIVLIDNKPRYKIIRADDTHQLYISFTTLLKNFYREDLETLWRIVKDRFSTSKPTNFIDEYLLLTFKTMFEEPDGQDAI
nr:hypothetical protein [Tanacetum cinerariifolium]